MKACFYSPYIPKHFGGGEKHLFDVALEVAKKHEVYVAIAKENKKSLLEIKKLYETFLNCSLDNINFIHSPIPNGSFIDKLLWTKQFDYLYYATDGSLFFSLAKKNILHIQIPFKTSKSSFVERLKLKNWQVKNTNSEFTKKIVQKSWQTKIDFVHYPKVSLDKISCKDKKGAVAKEKIILHVGRFFRQLHSKRQDVLLDIFDQLTTKYPVQTKDWQLVLIGNVEDKQYYKEVLIKAKKINSKYSGKNKQNSNFQKVVVLDKVSRKELLDYYCRASIYWHATGFGVDENKHPEKMEHFGITTIEAMASGCIPIVYGQGGQVEILGSSLKELFWQTKQECVSLTLKVIDSVKQARELRKKSLVRVKNFGQVKFGERLWEMFS